MLSMTDHISRARAWAQFNPGCTNSPFKKAPLFRLEVELSNHESWFGMTGLRRLHDTEPDTETARLENLWLELNLSPTNSKSNGEKLADLYPTLFSDPVPVSVEGKLVSAAKGKSLADIFSLGHLPEISTEQLLKLLSKATARNLAVYDVGQGNANALIGDGCGFPTLYFDLGAGVYRNKHTTPNDLRFCFTEKPPIILSHWDADHWAGTYATSVGGEYPALKQLWIAPLQEVGPIHIAFAHDVLESKGEFFTSTTLENNIGISTLTSDPNITVHFTLGTGADRNNSGIVLAVVNNSHPSGPRSWILTGDCEYKFFMPALSPADPVAIVVPHHGADLRGGSKAPPPVSTDTYKRLVYSFGANNSQGKTNVQHPTGEGVTAHSSWNHGGWVTGKIGWTMPNGDVLATTEHKNAPFRGGCLVGWSSSPVTRCPPCGGHLCTAELKQS